MPLLLVELLALLLARCHPDDPDTHAAKLLLKRRIKLYRQKSSVANSLSTAISRLKRIQHPLAKCAEHFHTKVLVKSKDNALPSPLVETMR